MDADKIIKTVRLAAPLEQVWDAIADARRFGVWFGVEIEGPFAAGRAILGRSVPTAVDPDVARLQEPYRGVEWRVEIERIQPMRLFSFRWRPFAVEQTRDGGPEPTTLVTFELQPIEGGALLTITESGFEKIPPDRRADARTANEGGWAHQTRLMERYLALNSNP